MISYTSESSVFDGGLSPAKIVPLIGSSTGFSALALLVSSLFKQYPSIAELENDGTALLEIMSSAIAPFADCVSNSSTPMTETLF